MMFRRFLSLALLTVLLVSGAFAQTAHPKKRSRKKAAPPPPPAPAVQPQPELSPEQLTLAQKPAVPPKVSYQNGLLTIQAENSTLSDILRAVHQQTGATMDLPPNATERVVTSLGPGLPRDVLAKLLNGSSFNYVMLGSATNPNDVRQVIVTSKSGGPDVSMASAPQQPVFNGRTPVNNQPENGAEVTGGAPDTTDNNESANDDATEEQGMSAEEPQVDEQTGDPAGSPGNAQQPQQQQGIKTPEQLLQELQRQQQMQQQQQTPQSAPQGFPPPPQNPEQ